MATLHLSSRKLFKPYQLAGELVEAALGPAGARSTALLEGGLGLFPLGFFNDWTGYASGMVRVAFALRLADAFALRREARRVGGAWG